MMLPLAASADLINEELVCRPETTTLTPHEYLRALSFDLRGIPPTMEEYAAIDDVGEVPENLIDEWIASVEFVDQAVVFHQKVFWNNLSNLRSHNPNTELATGPGKVFYRRRLSRSLRNSPTYSYTPCLDEPAQFTADGELVVNQMEDGTLLEGYVMVNPYWAPDTEIKVCGMDAQTAEFGDMGKACRTTAGHKDKTCGCGSDLQWCAYKGKAAVWSGFQKDLDLRVAWLIENDKSYISLLTDTPAYVNGPMVHYLRHHDAMHGGLSFMPHAAPKEALPDIDYTDDAFVEMKQASTDSGVLTSPAFLLRFQTNRSRANKYYADFLCSPFVAPPGGLPPASDVDALETDLQIRPGCAFCHAELEPASSYWGRWLQNGAGFLPLDEFPMFSDACEACGSGTNKSKCGECAQYTTKALTPSEKPWFGYLKPFMFRKPEHIAFPDEGPKLLVYRTAVDHRLPSCMTSKVAWWLLGRPPLAEEKPWLSEVAQQFAAGDFRFKELVKVIVTSDMYRNVR